MIKACVFDLDGTLLDTLEALNLTISETLMAFGYKGIDKEHTKQFVGDGYEKLVEKALIYSGDKNLSYFEPACLKYIELFKKHCMYKVHAYDGITELLSNLKSKQLILSVLSNKPQARTEDNIYSIFGHDMFSKVYGERDNIPRKPNPEALLSIFKELGIKAEECLYVGDTNTDMITGKAAGAITTGVLWGFRDYQELSKFKPEYIINHPKDIINIINNINIL